MGVNTNRKHSFRRIACSLLALLLCMGTPLPVFAAPGDDVQTGVLCTLTPRKSSYKTGETIQFTLNAQYADPGTGVDAPNVKIGIPLPQTTPQLQLPMFSKTGTGDYAGVPMHSISNFGISIDLYLVTLADGSRRIEFTLHPGDTVQGVLSMRLPNGVSAPVPELTLTPKILSTSTYEPLTLEGGTTQVLADFGWNNVQKIGSTENLGVISAATKDPDRIDYTITADSLSSGIDTGRIFTERYVLSDTLRLNGLHYNDGDLTSTESNGKTEYLIGGNKVLEVDKPASSLSVEKVLSNSTITGFNITYTANNDTLHKTNGTAQELENLNVHVSLLLAEMKLNAGNEDTSVVNSATFDAYSPFYTEQNNTVATHHDSDAAHTANTSDRYSIEKKVYSDAACASETTVVADTQEVWYKIVATNNSSGNGPFSIIDELPAGMTYQSASTTAPTQDGQTLTWSNVTIPSGGSHTIILKAKFDAAKFDANPVHNTVVLRNEDGQRLVSDYADVRYLAGLVDTASIDYTKSVNKTSAGQGEDLRYTITAKNQQTSAPARLITITDKWPGENVRPTKITGCSDYELLDAANIAHTLAEVQADNSIVITKINLYNVPVPKGGKATVLIDGIVTKPVTELKNSLIGSEGQNLVETYSVGVGISKKSYAYATGTNFIGDELTNANAVLAGDVVCYQMTVKNLTDLSLTGLTLTDRLPAGLTPVSGTAGVSGQSIIKHENGTYSSITLTPGTATTAYTLYTTGTFNLAANETATVYLFANVSQTAIDNSKSTRDCITNAAYINLPGGLVTGDATSNIYTFVDTTQAFHIKKDVAFVADYADEDLTTPTTRMLHRGNDSLQWKKNDIVWNGAYIGYRFELINRNTSGANRDPVRVYELIDTLPQEMEFVGVCVKGNSDSYFINDNAATVLVNLGSQLIRDGETGTWSNSEYSAEKLTCNYDKTTNKVHITFNEDSSGVLPVKYHEGGAATNLKPFIYLVARIKEGAKPTLYRNVVEAKVNDTVELNTLGDTKSSSIEGNGEDDGYRFISNYFDLKPFFPRPFITKDLVGHYYPQGTETPDTVQNEDSLFPRETLRFRLQVGFGAGTNSVISANRVHINLQNFTVTDILPAEYIYRPGSTQVTLNVIYNTTKKVLEENVGIKRELLRGTFEPSIELLDDGRTKLTWNFDGPENRLFCEASDIQYFVHLITYDTDWNDAYPSTYGNYINEATVTHSEDFTSVYSGVPDYAKKTVTATEVVNVFGTAGTVALKQITNSENATTDGNQVASQSNILPITGTDKKVTYTLSVKNSSKNSDMKSVVIIDELSRATDDTGVVNRKNRASEFNMTFGATPDVSVYSVDEGGVQKYIAGYEYTVNYGMSAGGLNSSGDWSNASSGGRITWGSNSDGMNAIRIAFNPEYVFSSGETIVVYFNAVAGDDADPGEIAWNSFGYTYRSVNLDDNTTSSKIYAEPLKVGAYIPSAQLKVTKAVTGDPAPANTEFKFVLKQGDTPQANVKYTIDEGLEAFRTEADGSFKLKAGETATLHVGAGTYNVEETPIPAYYTFESATATTASDGTDNAAVFTFKPLELNQSAGALFTNNFTMPPTINLTVEKKWKGETNPAQPTSVDVQLYRDGAAEGTPTTLNEANNWKHIWNDLDNQNAVVWTVREVTPLPVGYVSTVTGDQLSGYTITNTYANPNTSIQVEKVWAGDTDPNRPTGIQVQLYRNNVAYNGPVELNAGNGWKYIWPNMDRSYTWTVREVSPLPYGYTSMVTGSATTGFRITNHYTAPGKLTVSKTVTGGGDANTLFTFRFTFSRTGSFPYSGSKTGTISTGGSIQLKHGERITIALPKGTTYTVVEDTVNKYIPTPEDRTFTGTIGNTESLAEFTNKYDAPFVPTGSSLTGNLTIQKTVTGDLGDPTKDFAFVVTFNAQGSYHFNGSKSGMISSGDTVYLRHSEYITIVNLPAGTTYSVVESNNRGYKVYASGETGMIVNNGNVKAAFTNSKSSVPSTGDDDSIKTGVTIMITAFCGIVLLAVAYRKVSKPKRRSTAKRT